VSAAGGAPPSAGEGRHPVEPDLILISPLKIAPKILPKRFWKSHPAQYFRLLITTSINYPLPFIIIRAREERAARASQSSSELHLELVKHPATPWKRASRASSEGFLLVRESALDRTLSALFVVFSTWKHLRLANESSSCLA
jgi:hypothetical protein